MEINRTGWAARLGSTATTVAPLAGGALALGADTFAPVGVAGGAVLTARAARQLAHGQGDRLTNLCTLAAGLTLTTSSAMACVPGPVGLAGKLLATASLAALTLPSLAQSAPHLKNALLGARNHEAPTIPTALPTFVPQRREFYRSQPIAEPAPGEPLLRQKALFIQIDGLSAPELQEAMQRGFMPNLQKLIESGDYVTDTWRCGLPSCTPAVQAGILHGNQEAMPGFRWYDKARQKFITGFEMKDHAQNFAPRAATNPGLVSGGASYTNQYVAGANQEAFNAEGISTLLSTRDRKEADGEVRAVRAFLERPSDVIDTLIHLPIEVGADFLDHLRSQEREENLKSWAQHPAIPVQRATVKNTLLRDVTTSAMKQDLADEQPVIFVDYGGYDGIGHLYNPTSLAALKSLRGIDRKVGELVREAGPDRKIFLFSDHGQTPSVPFHKQYGQMFQEFLGDDIVYASSGNLSHLYVKSLKAQPNLDEVDPAFVHKLIAHPGIQIVVGRTPDGIEVRGEKGSYYRKHDGTCSVKGENPLKDYPDQPEVLAAQMADLFTPEVAGDVIVFGAANGNSVVDLEDVYAMGVGLQFGAHGGVGGRQTIPFLVYPKDVPLETGAMQNSSDLYFQLVHHLK